VPIQPDNTFADAVEKANPYPYDPVAAAKLLTDNGWTVNAGGISTCTNPGTGSGQCGDGVKAGAKASFALQYASGTLAIDQEMQVMKTAFSKAGIEINLSQAPFDTVISTAFGGNPNWEMANWGGGWIFAPDYYPTGDEIFSTGAGSNAGAYSNATNDANTVASTKSNDVQALYTYEDFLAKDLPVVWIPVAAAELSMVKKTLHGWDPQDPLLQIYPENWYFTSS
jgi:peptide/nickel transport system substrate-binding protein